MQITIEEATYYAVTDCRILAIQGEANTRSVHFTYPAVSGAEQYFLRVQLPESLIYDLPITENTVVLPASVTGYAGIVPIQWIAKNSTGSVIAKSQLIPSIVKPSIQGDATALPTPEELITKYDEYLNTMRDIQQDVTKKSETVKADADRAESCVSRAEALLQSMQGMTIGERARLYVDVESGSDTNNGKATTTAVQTIDRALILANAYQQAIICLKKGQTYTATDKSNEYGMGIQLYHRTLRFEAYGTGYEKPKIQNAIFAYSCNLEWKEIDFTANNGVFTMYNTICSFEKCSLCWVDSRNSFARLAACNLEHNWKQYGGFSVISNGTTSICKIHCLDAKEGARIECGGCRLEATMNDGTSAILKYGIPDNLSTVKKIAEESVATQTIYVDAVNGADSRDGTTQAKALQTLSRALYFAQYARKAVIYLAAGTYTIPDKTLTLLGQDVRIYGDAAATTIIKGNIVCENGFLLMRRVTIDSTDSTTVDTITLQYRAAIRMVDCSANAAGKNAISVMEMSNANLVNTTFQGATQYAVYVTGLSDAKIYTCTDATTKGVRSGGGSVVYINNATGTSFPYTSGSNGMVFVDGQQVLPQPGSIQFRHGKGTFTATAAGTNVMWQHGGQQVQDNKCTFDVKSDNGLICMDFDSITSLSITNDTALKLCLSDLGGNITYTLTLSECSDVTGDLSDLGGKIKGGIALNDCPSITGDLSDLGGNINRSIILANCTAITGVYTGTVYPKTFTVSKTSITAADMDANLINFAASGVKSGRFTAASMTRTAASDDAVATLVTNGWTVSGLKKEG